MTRVCFVWKLGVCAQQFFEVLLLMILMGIYHYGCFQQTSWSLHRSKHLCRPPGSIHKLTHCSVFRSTTAFEHVFWNRAEIEIKFGSFMFFHRGEFGKSHPRNERKCKTSSNRRKRVQKGQTSEYPKHGTGNLMGSDGRVIADNSSIFC